MTQPTDKLALPLASPQKIDVRLQSADTEAAVLINNESLLRTGWLYKRGGKTKAWKKRWFVLRRDRFAYYNDQTEYETRKVVQVDNISGITCRAGGKRVNVTFYVGSKEVHLQAETQQDADEWVKALKLASSLGSQRSGPTSPIDIVSREGSNRQENTTNTKPRIFSTSVGTNSQASPPMATSNSMSNFVPFSDDDFSQTGFSDEEITSPLSATTTNEAHVVNDTTAQRKVNDDPEHDKVIIQGYLRRHFNAKRRGSSKFWAVLRPYGLYLYPDHTEYRPSKIVPIVQIVDASDIPLDDHLSSSHHSKKGAKLIFQVITKEKALRFSVEGEKQLDEWVGALKSRLERESLRQQRQHN